MNDEDSPVIRSPERRVRHPAVVGIPRSHAAASYYPVRRKNATTPSAVINQQATEAAMLRQITHLRRRPCVNQEQRLMAVQLRSGVTRLRVRLGFCLGLGLGLSWQREVAGLGRSVTLFALHHR